MNKETTMTPPATPTINPDRLAELDNLALDHGGHGSFTEGHCAMEAVAWLAGEPHSDTPACACPVIARAMIRLNDRIKDQAMRTELLRPLLPRIVGSRASREVMIKRGFLAADMAVHIFAPLALEKRGKLDLAAKLRGAPEIVDVASARAAEKIAREVRSADAAYAYAYDAARARKPIYELGVQMIERMLEIRE